ncbi:amidohydrolase [Caproiciproducens sp. CPB-2]|uniref:amidohydrolase n=1 Tax=Caproiciproducens sp. CPB-2 TaxID=3030017 RepID=UPI0023DC1D37|nr:amidohydrolase [Caproiciproducens sp. CPB-2]MDF1493998.1 amidohydrolase [Caproiciproducens sp. CPB-2]
MDEKTLQNTLEEHFSWLHRHPETALREFETTAYIKRILTENSVKILDSGLQTGLVAVLRGKKEKPVVALRCDIDALPIEEAADVPYRSENPGKMHACGHDFHTTAMLGAALLLKQKEADLEGTVKLLFQPAEEAEHGAEHVLKTGALDDVEEIYGLHVAAGLPAGTVAVTAGADHAAVDRFVVDVTGLGGHAAHPELVIDPILAASQLTGAFQTIVSRSLSAFDRAVISVTRVEAGSTWNVIPSSAQLEGTVRTLDKAIRQKIVRRMKEICEGIATVSGASVRFHWYPGCPATNNDAELAAFVKDTAQALGLRTQEAVPSMGGEDFSCYQEKIRGAFWMIGVGDTAPLHNPSFKADRSGLTGAAKLLSALGERALTRINSGEDR